MDTAGPYRIFGQLGAGGMGVVYRAEDTRLGRQVALKFLSPVLDGDGRAAARLEREARTASSLNHPNICTIYEIGEHEGRRFIAMEFLEGTPLPEAIAGRPMEPARVLDLGIQIADALDAAHAAGIVHRDVKPANIFVTKRGYAKVLDFGIARLAADSPSGAALAGSEAATLLSTQPGTVTGTIAYMSPEQALSHPVDARTDVFSLGLVLYEMATGRQMFDGTTPAAVYDAILNREPPPATASNPALPPGFDEILDRALEKDPALRYQTASDLRADLQRLKRNVETQRLTRSALGQPAATVINAPAPGSNPAADSAPSALQPPTLAASAPVAASRGTHWALPALGGVAVAAVAMIVVTRLNQSPPAPAATPSTPPTAGSVSPPAVAPTASASSALPQAASEATASERPREAAKAEKAAKPAALTPILATPTTPAVAPSAPMPSAPAPSAPAPPQPIVQASVNPAAAGPPASADVASPSNAGRGSPELDGVRAKMQAKDFDGAATELRGIIATHKGDRAPLEAYNALVDLEERRNEHPELNTTIDDLVSRFHSDPRVPAFLLRHAEGAMLKAKLQGHVLYARQLAKRVVDDYPASPESVGAKALLNQIDEGRGRRGGGGE